MMHGFQQIVAQAEGRYNFVVHGLSPLGDEMAVSPLIWRGVIALFPQWKTVSLSECGRLQGAPLGGMLEVSSNHHSSLQEPLYDPYYADQGPVDNHLAAFGGATLRLTGPG